MTNRQAIARECLRQAWQILDAGGVSMGRSAEATWIELAMDLIDGDGRHSKLADTDLRAFHRIATDAVHNVRVRRHNKRDRELGYKQPRKRTK